MLLVNSIEPYNESRCNYRRSTGIYNSLSGPIQFESLLQRDAYVILDFEPSVHALQTPSRWANYLRGCLIITTSGTRLVADVRHEEELQEKWYSLQSKFQEVQEICSQDGSIFGIITDNAVYSCPNRLDVLKWVKFTGRNCTQDPGLRDELYKIFSSQLDITFGSLMKKANGTLCKLQLIKYVNRYFPKHCMLS